ncbi:MAG: hypothetical protein ABEH66_00855 [Halobacteriales archaeon]
MTARAATSADVERFAAFIVGGGLALVAGLWIVAWFRAGSAPWLLGVGLALAGTAGVSLGIWMEIDTE